MSFASAAGTCCPSRRRLLTRALFALLIPAAHRVQGAADDASVPPPDDAATQAAPIIAPTQAGLDALQIAEGVYVLPGRNAEPTAGNLGRVGNLGFLVGTQGVLVLDTGSSRSRGDELLQAIAKVTPKPVLAVVITHPAQEFLFGNSAFQALGIPIYAHPQTPRLMRSRCVHCLETLNAVLGAKRMHGTELILPQALPVPAALLQRLGRRVNVRDAPRGAPPGSLLIRDEVSGVLFSGALLSLDRVPAVQDTRPLDWVYALRSLAAEDVLAIVPAYGPLAWRTPRPGQRDLGDATDALIGYLEALEARSRQLYAQSIPLAELEAAGALPRFSDWSSYLPHHRQNVFYRYLQLEAEDLEGI